MFERFKKNRTTDERAAGGRTAVADHPQDADVAATSVDQRRADEQREGIAGSTGRAPVTRAGDERPVGDEIDDRTAVRDPEHHDHAKRDAAVAGGAGFAAGEAAGRHHERKREREIAREEPSGIATGRRGTATEADGVRRHSPVLEAEALATMRQRQRARYGGISWGAAFFGLLCAIGLAAILTSILAAAGAAIGLNQLKSTANAGNKTLSLGGGILLLVVLAIAWYCGGYVAGRMARFDGARQGVAVWIWTILFVALVTVAAVIGGSEYDVASRLNLPSIPTNNQTYATGGLIAAVAAALVTLLFAVLGGKAGDLFHRRVDRIATDEYHEPA